MKRWQFGRIASVNRPKKSMDLPDCDAISTVKLLDELSADLSDMSVRPAGPSAILSGLDGLSADLPDMSVRAVGPSAMLSDRQGGL